MTCSSRCLCVIRKIEAVITNTDYINSDRFVFNSGAPFNATDLGVDRINDFNPTQDKIVLDKTTFVGLIGLSIDSTTSISSYRLRDRRVVTSLKINIAILCNL